MKTKLKNFESSFNNIQQANRIIEMMEACKSSQSSFSTVFPCFKASYENSTLIYNGNDGYHHYDVSNLLHHLPVTLDGGVSYDGLLSGSSLRGYSIDLPVFHQDLQDLSGALHRSTDFRQRQNIKTTYKSVNELRSELDQKMKEIYDPDDQDTYILHNQSIYMTLSWTIIATSVLFYLFAKL